MLVPHIQLIAETSHSGSTEPSIVRMDLGHTGGGRLTFMGCKTTTLTLDAIPICYRNEACCAILLDLWKFTKC